MEKTVKFKVEKETNNTVRFNEIPDEGRPPIIESFDVIKYCQPSGSRSGT